MSHFYNLLIRFLWKICPHRIRYCYESGEGVFICDIQYSGSRLSRACWHVIVGLEVGRRIEGNFQVGSFDRDLLSTYLLCAIPVLDKVGTGRWRGLLAWDGGGSAIIWEGHRGPHPGNTLGAVQVVCMDKYRMDEYRLRHLEEEQLLLVVTKTFGNIDISGNGEVCGPGPSGLGNGRAQGDKGKDLGNTACLKEDIWEWVLRSLWVALMSTTCPCPS